MQRSGMSSPTNRVPVPYLHNVVPEPNLPPLPEPGNGVYILLCDAAHSTDAVPSQSGPTSVSREGQTAKRCAEVTMLQKEFCFPIWRLLPFGTDVLSTDIRLSEP